MVLLIALSGCDPFPVEDDCNWTVSPFDGQSAWDPGRKIEIGAEVEDTTAGVADAFRIEGPDGVVSFDVDIDSDAIGLEPRDLASAAEYTLVISEGLPGGRNVELVYRPPARMVGRYTFYTGSRPRPVCILDQRCVQFSEDLEPRVAAAATVTRADGTVEDADLSFLRSSTSLLCLAEDRVAPRSVYLPDGAITGEDGASLDGDGDGRPGGAAVIDFDALPACDMGCGSPWTDGPSSDTGYGF
jgi:hypothetical protein